MDRAPWAESFKGALQTITSLLPLLSTRLATAAGCQSLLEAIATRVVGNRTDRIEPRVKKRRSKPYKLMMKRRENYQRRMTA